MTEKSAAERIGLKLFVNEELLFYADPEWQYEEWKEADGERFGHQLVRYLLVWESVDKYRNELPISRTQFGLLDELYDMLMHFQTVNDHPENPREYLMLLRNPKWIKIQRFARRIYDNIVLSERGRACIEH